ncbi:MAG: hypothetical protein PHI93_11930 [Kiritimatiellae bacterium]|jgi:hypothetical protein|nr:hypothetical protein [Kiritimatiellia bacterium]
MKIIGKVILIGIALIFAFYVISFAVYIYSSISKHNSLSSLKNPAEVALACRATIQALGTNEQVVIQGNDPILPATLQNLKPRYIVVEATNLRAEFHGGFNHYGLEFTPKDPSHTDGAWVLNYYTESPQRKQLYELQKSVEQLRD